MSRKLDGKTALVTGASRGIGAAIAKGLAAEVRHEQVAREGRCQRHPKKPAHALVAGVRRRQ